MSYMSAMMAAMENSIMGVMMGNEGGSTLQTILKWTIALFPFATILSVIVGLILRKRSGEDRNV
jgi:hypothetical protein